jgi:hypothetical protein
MFMSIRRAPAVTRLFEGVGFNDGVRVGVLRILSGKHLLHLVLGSCALLDEGFGPRFYRLVGLSQ